MLATFSASGCIYGARCTENTSRAARQPGTWCHSLAHAQYNSPHRFGKLRKPQITKVRAYSYCRVLASSCRVAFSICRVAFSIPIVSVRVHPVSLPVSELLINVYPVPLKQQCVEIESMPLSAIIPCWSNRSLQLLSPVAFAPNSATHVLQSAAPSHTI